MALPRDPKAAPIRSTRKVSIGEYVQKSKGFGYPQTDDKFTIRRREPNRDTWVLDQVMQERLVELTGEKKPQSVPFYSPYAEVEEAIFSELAVWASNQRNVCRCGQFARKTEGTLEAQGLEVPRTEKEWQRCDQRYYVGTALRTIWRPNADGYPMIAERRRLTCDPATCPFATGQWDHEGRQVYKDAYGKWPSKKCVEESQVLCNPHTLLKMLLPPAIVGDVSPRAKFSTPSWHSSMALIRTFGEIREMCGGFVQGIPLKIVLTWDKMTTPAGMQEVGLVHLEPAVSWADLPALGEATAEKLQASVAAQRQIKSQMKMLDGIVEEDEAEDIDAFLREHDIPRDQTAEDWVEKRFRELAKKLPQPWTDAAIQSYLADATPTDLYEMVGSFERDLGMAPEVDAVDVDFEDAPNEAQRLDVSEDAPPQQEPPAEAYEDAPDVSDEEVRALFADYEEGDGGE